MTPWWLRPTAEGANEEKDDTREWPNERAASKTPEAPAPEPQAAPAFQPTLREEMRNTRETREAREAYEARETPPPPLEIEPEAEPDWRTMPVPEREMTPAAPASAYEPESAYLERSAEPVLEERATDEGEDEEDDDEGAVAVEGAEPGETGETSEADAREGRRRRPRRSRARRKPATTASSLSLDTDEDEEPVQDEPLYEEPAPIAPVPAPPAPAMRRPAQPAPMARREAPSRELREPKEPREPREIPRETFVVPRDMETLSREIVITMPERQRVADERKIAMFCDLENIALGVRDSEVGKFDIELILERLLEKGKIIVKKAYADWERYSEYKRPFHEAAIELIDIPQKYYSGKNSADIKMVVDAMDLSYSKEHLDTFVILSGDSDFSPLVSKLKENNKYVIGVGVKNSSSALLIDNCDEFLYYEDVWRDTQKGPKLDGLNKKTAEAFSLMIDAIQALTRENKDVLWGSMIKQTMQRKKPSFNEGYYGYPSFSELLEDAERKNIIRLKKDQRSGTYVVIGFAKGSEPPAVGGRR